jgi:hypothetical protein
LAVILVTLAAALAPVAVSGDTPVTGTELSSAASTPPTEAAPPQPFPRARWRGERGSRQAASRVRRPLEAWRHDRGDRETQRPESAARIKVLSDDAGRALDDEPSAVTLDGLTEQWQMTHAVLSGHVNVLAQRATAIEDALEQLSRPHDLWARAPSRCTTFARTGAGHRAHRRSPGGGGDGGEPDAGAARVDPRASCSR